MMKRDSIFKRAINIFKQEGIAALIKRTLLFLKYVFSCSYDTYYVYENNLDVSIIPPKIQNASLKIVENPEQFDGLIKEGYDFSGWNLNTYKLKVNFGAVAFCVFVYNELASIVLVSLNNYAQKEVDPYLNIDWSTEACHGWAHTKEKFRGLGIQTYAYSELFNYVKNKGRTKDKFRVRKWNLSSQNLSNKSNSKIIGEGYILKILWWRIWKNTFTNNPKNDNTIIN
jgi:hypothetical protein